MKDELRRLSHQDLVGFEAWVDSYARYTILPHITDVDGGAKYAEWVVYQIRDLKDTEGGILLDEGFKTLYDAKGEVLRRIRMKE